MKMGLTKENDRLPKIMTVKLSEGGAADRIPNLDVQLREYYKLRQWDWKTATPKKEILEELGISDLSQV